MSQISQNLKWQQTTMSKTINYYFNTIKLQILYKQNWLQFLFVVKTTALNSKYQNFIRTFCIGPILGFIKIRSGFWSHGGVEICHFPLLWLLAFLTTV